MALPSGNLIQTFTNLVLDFNAAYGLTYDTWGNAYLHPTSNNIFIQKVDDPGQYKDGDRAAIINYLNRTQTPGVSGNPPDDFYPQFSNSGTPHESIHTNTNGDVVGDVTPSPGSYGIYYNSYGKYKKGKGIQVHYTLRFELYQDVWCLCTALVVPI
jgi:hypothetical protein